MKKVITILILLFSLTSYAQNESKVKTVNGVEVYILAEPVREYKPLESSGKGIQWGSFITGGLVNESISTKISKYVKRLSKEYRKSNIDFDAVIYSNGKQMTAIKFTDEKTPKNNRKAVVSKIRGIPFFVMSEPIKKYDYIKSVKGGIKWKSALTAGLVNNSIEQDLMKFAKKSNKEFKRNEISAIMYSRGKRANAIKFSN